MSHKDHSKLDENYQCFVCEDIFEGCQRLSLHSQLAHPNQNSKRAVAEKSPTEVENDSLVVLAWPFAEKKIAKGVSSLVKDAIENSETTKS